MPRRRAAVLAVTAVWALTLTGGVATARSFATPSPVPQAALGHPGNPIVIRDGAFRVHGPAGSIVHIRLTQQLVPPPPRDFIDDGVLSSSMGWGALVLTQRREALTLATVSTRFLCGDQPCPNALLSSSNGSDLAPGDYVLALAGPVGSVITAELSGDDVTHEPPLLPTYVQPFVARDLPPLVRTPDQGARGGWSEPPLGHRTLALSLVGFRNGGGGNGLYVDGLCPGGYVPVTAERASSGTGCSGGYGFSGTSGSISNENETGLPIPLPDQVTEQGWARFDAYSLVSTQEGFTGASWGAYCGNANCSYHGAGFAVLLDE